MTEDATILRHHPCDRTLQVPLWRRCRGRQPSKAPRCWPTTPILPSIQNLSEVVPTRPYSGSLVPAAFATGSIRWDRTRLPRIPRCSLLPKERGAAVAPAIGLNEPIIAQDGDPGIPMSAARLFAHCGRQLLGVDIAFALGGEGAQHFGRRRGQPATPQGKPLDRCRRRWRQLTRSLQANRRRRQEIVHLLDIARFP